jgi:hypothetical protein
VSDIAIFGLVVIGATAAAILFLFIAWYEDDDDA